MESTRAPALSPPTEMLKVSEVGPACGNLLRTKRLTARLVTTNIASCV